MAPMPTGQLTPSEQQGGTGAGNSGFTGAEGYAFRALKAGDAHVRAQFCRTMAEYGKLGGVVNFTALDIIAAEAIASLLPEPKVSVPDAPARPPVEPSNRPDKE